MTPEEIEAAERERLAQEAATRARARLAEQREKEAIAFERRERRRLLWRKTTRILGYTAVFAIFFLFLAFLIPRLKSGRPSASLIGNYSEGVPATRVAEKAPTDKKLPEKQIAEISAQKEVHDALFDANQSLEIAKSNAKSIRVINDEIRLLTLNLQSKTI